MAFSSLVRPSAATGQGSWFNRWFELMLRQDWPFVRDGVRENVGQLAESSFIRPSHRSQTQIMAPNVNVRIVALVCAMALRGYDFLVPMI
ncbi:hypothetical protein [Reichenbachiella ulvae]|uniref:Uncharacterized protein n=1 Tax=Reichenbachiella ulvae TaxID=2980104 RepID=A0ABT3CTQ7_9BACT|nr:hypothetical protein [Reichenbachiella ulvae]MCV9386977.1 hypothetical protein [Reichenbachiella ulvae]